MHFTTVFTSLATVALALANSVTFVSLDETDRTIVFTPSIGNAEIADAQVPGGAEKRVEFPHGWIGNWYSVSAGAPREPGMLGEVTFDGWGGMTYFDVSAIVNPHDHVGVKVIYPASAVDNTSGCDYFPCNNAYYLPNDIQTKTTMEKDLVCTLGGSTASKRDVSEGEGQKVARSYVLGGM